MAETSLSERIARVERTCDYLATKESLAVIEGKMEGMQRELRIILVLCSAILLAMISGLITVLLRAI